jgi:hypothetical protein
MAFRYYLTERSLLSLTQIYASGVLTGFHI